MPSPVFRQIHGLSYLTIHLVNMTSARIVRGFLACSLGILIPLSGFADVVDLGVTATVKPSTHLPPGSAASVTVTVTNYGPDDATYIAAGSSVFWEGQGEQIQLYPTEESSKQCDFYYNSIDPAPGGPIPYSALLLFTGKVLPPGTSISCTIGLSVFPDAKGQYALYFVTSNDVVGSVDPNPSNDQSRNILLNLSPITVPTLGTLGCTLLGLIIVFFGLGKLKIPTANGVRVPFAAPSKGTLTPLMNNDGDR